MDLNKIYFEFQPIINLNTGRVLGYEAYLRGFRDLGFFSIKQFFDYFYEKRELFDIDLILRKKAISEFVKIEDYYLYKLFFNLDSRVIEMSNYKKDLTKDILEKYGMKPSQMCFDINQLSKPENNVAIINLYKGRYQISLDNFGVQNSCFKFLYDISVDYIKLDEFWIKDIENDLKKQDFLKFFVDLAKTLEIKIIAKNLETKAQFFIMKNIGLEYANGSFISKSTSKVSELKNSYCLDILKSTRKNDNSYKHFVLKEQFVYLDSSLNNILNLFKNDNIEYLPVLDKDNYPVGYIDYRNMKHYLTNQYGISILQNERKRYGNINFIISKALVTDIHTNVETIISLFAKDKKHNLLILTKDEKYYGILTSNELVNIIHERKILEARDLNPITSLPGNRLIDNFMIDNIGKRVTTLIYFDFNNFKPFNDIYGFRVGDRAIFMFSDILQKYKKNNFIGHIGGDDFFMGFVNGDSEKIYKIVDKMVRKFSKEAESLYKKEDIKNSYIIGKDRDGSEKKFPLLSISAAILEFREIDSYNENIISEILGKLKKEAKKSDNYIVYASVLCG